MPFAFIVLQAIFPLLGHGSLAAPFSHLPDTLSDPALLRMSLNTVALGVVVALLSAFVAIPLAVCRALFRLPGAPVWDARRISPRWAGS